MLKSYRLYFMAISILFMVSSVQAANNIEHLWTDSTLSNTVGISSDENYAYIADRNLGLVIMAISDTLPPQFISSYDPGVPVFDICVDGNYAYLGAGISEPYTGWLLIVNISDRSNPAYVGMYQTNWEITRVAVDHYAYCLQYTTLKIIDISDPANPAEVGSLSSVSNAIDIYARGNYVYLACQNLGLRIVDVSNPESPILIGNCDTPGVAIGVTMRDIDSTHVYIADGSAGVQIIDVSDPANPSIRGNYLTRADALSIAGGVNFVYTTLRDSSVAVVMVGNPRYTRLVGEADIAQMPNGIDLAGGSGYASGITAISANNLDCFRIKTSTCPVIPGDINGNGRANGIDVSYGVGYFKGGPLPPQLCHCWTHPDFCLNGDVNASCQFNGVDITYMVGYWGGHSSELLQCTDCPGNY